MTPNHNSYNQGHRKRLRNRFFNNPSSVEDYELLELLHFWSIPRKDVKPIAKELLIKFKSLSNVIHSDHESLSKITTENSIINIAILKEIQRRILKEDVMHKNVLGSWTALIDYLKQTMGNMKIEQFRVIFLNKKNIIIADEVQGTGTIDETPVYPREIVKKAISHSASAIILIHNHPSGDPTPSKADITLTKKITIACDAVDIKVHDHVIIAKSKFYSFKANYLI